MDTNSLLQANIIDLLGLQALPEERKQALVSQMGTVVEDRVMDRILSGLNETQKQELDKILEQDTPGAVDAFIARNVPNLNAMMQEEVLRMKTEMSADLNSMKAAAGLT